MNSNFDCFFDINFISWFQNLCLKKFSLIFFRETNVFIFCMHSTLFSLIIFASCRYVRDFSKMREFFFNFVFAIRLISFNIWRIESIVVVIFNRNCKISFCDMFNILFFIHYCFLSMCKLICNHAVITFKFKLFFHSIYEWIVIL